MEAPVGDITSNRLGPIATAEAMRAYLDDADARTRAAFRKGTVSREWANAQIAMLNAMLFDLGLEPPYFISDAASAARRPTETVDVNEPVDLLRPVFAGVVGSITVTAADMVTIFSAVPPDIPVGIYNVSGGGAMTMDMIYPGEDGVDIDMSRTDPHPLL